MMLPSITPSRFLGLAGWLTQTARHQNECSRRNARHDLLAGTTSRRESWQSRLCSQRPSRLAILPVCCLLAKIGPHII